MFQNTACVVPHRLYCVRICIYYRTGTVPYQYSVVVRYPKGIQKFCESDSGPNLVFFAVPTRQRDRHVSMCRLFIYYLFTYNSYILIDIIAFHAFFALSWSWITSIASHNICRELFCEHSFLLYLRAMKSVFWFWFPFFVFRWQFIFEDLEINQYDLGQFNICNSQRFIKKMSTSKISARSKAPSPGTNNHGKKVLESASKHSRHLQAKTSTGSGSKRTTPTVFDSPHYE